MSKEFQENIKEWVSLDNRIKLMQKEVKEIRIIKNELTDHIFTYAEDNNLENAVIQISDGKLKFQNVKSTSPLSYGFLEQCLLECINDENQVKELIMYIKSKRTHKMSYDIKRSYRKDI
jgi:hypothetical protein